MEIKTRKNFPETWLWETVTTDETGRATLDQLVIPDTITSWILTGFSMSTVSGLGVTDAAEKITAFQKFFIKLYLPYSIKVKHCNEYIPRWTKCNMGVVNSVDDIPTLAISFFLILGYSSQAGPVRFGLKFS